MNLGMCFNTYQVSWSSTYKKVLSHPTFVILNSILRALPESRPFSTEWEWARQVSHTIA